MQYIFPCKPNRVEKDSPLLHSLNDTPEWAAEVKRNGWRCLAMMDENGKLTLWTRHKTVINDPLVALRELLGAMLPKVTLVDGEVLERRTKQIKGEFYAFDLLWLRGRPVWHLPLTERRKGLEQVIIPDGVHITIPEWRFEDKIGYYEQNIEGEDVEGIVIKRIDSKYMPSFTRCLQHPLWLKLKKKEDHLRAA